MLRQLRELNPPSRRKGLVELNDEAFSLSRFDPLAFNDPLHVAWAEDPAYLPPSVAYTDPILGLVLPGVAGNYAYLPDAPAYDITGDITLVARVALTDWTPSAATTLIAKWESDPNRSYNFYVNATTGVLVLQTSPTGNFADRLTWASTIAPTVADGAVLWVAVSLDVDNGAANSVTKFWTSTDGVTWTQLGADRTAAVTSVASGASTLLFGQAVGGSSLAGNLSVARIYSGSGFSAAGPSGSLVLDVDFRRAKTQTFPAVGDYGVKFGEGLVLPGLAGNYASTPDSPALDITGDLTLAVRGVLPDWTPSASTTLMAKRSDGTQVSWEFRLSNAGKLVLIWSEDGTATLSATALADLTLTNGSIGSVAATLDVDNGAGNRVVKFWESADGETWSQVGATVTIVGTTSIFSGTSIVEFGSYGAGTANVWAGTIVRASAYSGSGFSAAGPSGTPVVDAYFAIQNDETQEFYDYCGNLVTVNVASQKVTVASAGAAIQQLQQGSVLTYGARLDPVEGLVLPGLAGNYATVPDAGIYDITGDLILVAQMTLDDWTPATINYAISKWNASSNQRSYLLGVSTTGRILLQWSNDGITVALSNTSMAPVPFADGETGWIAASFDVDDGAGNRVIKFWTSTDGTTWSQLGATVTTAGTTSIFSGTSPVEFGSSNGGASFNLYGSIQVARIYSGSTFTAAGPDASMPCVLDLDFRREATQGFQGTSDYGIKADGLVLPGIGGSYATINDDTTLDILGDLALVAKATMSVWVGSGISQQTFLSKWASTGNQRSYLLSISSSGTLRFISSADGITGLTAVSTVAVPFANGETGYVAATLDVDNGAGGRDVRFWTSTDGATWTQLGSTVTTAGTTSVFASTSPLEFGSHLSGTSEPFAGTIHFGQVYSGAGFDATGPLGALQVDADFESQPAETLVFDASVNKIIPGEGMATNGAFRSCIVTPIVAPGQVNLTTDFELIHCLRMDDWTPSQIAYLMGHWGVSGTYHLAPFIGVGGSVGLTYSTDGTTGATVQTGVLIDTVAIPGEFCWLRLRLDVDDGAGGSVWSVDYSLDPVDTDPSAVSWTVLDSVTYGSTTSLFTGSSTNLCVGALNTGATFSVLGTTAYCSLAGAFDGPRLFELDLRNKNAVERGFNATSAYGIKQGQGLVLPPLRYPTTSVAGPWADVPDSAALSITGDLTLVAHATVDDWSPAGFYGTFISKRRDAAQRSYMLRVTPTGLVELVWSADGSTLIQVQSTSAAPFANGAEGWVAATLDVDNGAAGNDVTFWTSVDGVTWTQLGTTVTTAGVTSVFDSTSPIDLGAALAGTTQNLNGTLHDVQIYSGSGFSAAGPSGTKVLDVDFTVPADDTTSFVCDTGQVVSIIGAQPLMVVQGNRLPCAVRGCYPQAYVVTTDGDVVDATRGLVSNGSGTGNVSLVAPSLSVNTGLDIRVNMDCPIPNRQDQQVVGQYSGAAATTRFLMYFTTAGNVQLFVSNGTSLVSTTFIIEPEFPTQYDWFRMTWRNADGEALLWVSDDGVTWSAISRAIVGSGSVMPTVTSTNFHIGANQLGAGGWVIGDIKQIEVRDGIDGNILLDADFRRSHTNAFIADSGQRVEVVSSLNPNNLTAAQQANYEAAVDIFNDAPAYHYDGTDDRHALLTGLYAAQPVWVVLIASWDTLPAATRLAMGLDSNSATRGLGQRTSGATHLDMGGTVTGGAYTANEVFMAVGYANGASGEVWLNGVLVATGATGAQAVNQMILGCGRLAASTYQNFFDGYMYFDALYQTDPMANPDWWKFARFARSKGAPVA